MKITILNFHAETLRKILENQAVRASSCFLIFYSNCYIYLHVKHSISLNKTQMGRFG